MDKTLIYRSPLTNTFCQTSDVLRFVLLFWLVSISHISLAQQVTLNFQDMDIRLLIDTVAEVTGKTFIVDPRVKAKVTVVSPHPMDSAEVYETFLSILNVHGFAAVRNNGVVKIVPESVAKSQNTPVYTAPQKKVSGDELVTQVVRVHHVSAAQIVPLLRPLVPQQGHLVAYPDNNTLVISDRANNVQRLMRIIKRIDQAGDKEIDVMMLEHASASEVVKIFNDLEQKNKAKQPGSNGHVSLVADDRTNSVLISGEQSARLRVRTLVTHLDTPLKSVGNTKVIYLKYAQASEIVNVLKGVSDTITEQKKAEGEKIEQAAGKTNIQADEATNSLVITATPDVLQNLESVIRQLDVRRAQVLVEAIIAEVAVDTAKSLGVQWLIDGTPNGSGPVGATNFTNAGNSIMSLGAQAYQIDRGKTTNIPDLGAGALLGLGRFKNSGFNFGLLVQALSSDSQTNILSTPSLLTLDNQEAEITVGQNVPFVTGQYTNTGANNGSTNPFQTIQREDIGIKLKVRPQINEGNAVKLELEQEVSSISPSSVSSADIITNKRKIRTTVMVEDGNMIILGGLINEDLQQANQKVPGLGDIPLLGHLFRSRSTTKVKRNLMVFLRPIIVRDGIQETLVTSGKYSDMRKKQLEQKQHGVALLDDEAVPVLPALDEYITVLPGEAPLDDLMLRYRTKTESSPSVN